MANHVIQGFNFSPEIVIIYEEKAHYGYEWEA
jgi:hypothetical protein